MLDMVQKDYLPAMARYSADLARGMAAKLSALPDADCSYERDTVRSISALIGATHRAASKLERDLLEAKSSGSVEALADFFQSVVLEDMGSLRISVDSMEALAATESWPVPGYGKLLFDVR